MPATTAVRRSGGTPSTRGGRTSTGGERGHVVLWASQPPVPARLGPMTRKTRGRSIPCCASRFAEQRFDQRQGLFDQFAPAFGADLGARRNSAVGAASYRPTRR